MCVRQAKRSVATRVGRRGTVVIPATFRHEFGLEEGTPIAAEARDGGVFLRPAAVELLTDDERQELIDGAVKACAALRADPGAWAAEQAERARWQCISGQALPPQAQSDDGFLRPATV